MRLGFPIIPGQGGDQPLRIALSDFFRKMAVKIDALSLGQISGCDNATTAMPTAGTWARGDIVRNSTPTVAGGGGAQYVITGWIRITDGSGNVLNTDWCELRSLTGT
jgi:hypothetical protein